MIRTVVKIDNKKKYKSRNIYYHQYLSKQQTFNYRSEINIFNKLQYFSTIQYSLFVLKVQLKPS